MEEIIEYKGRCECIKDSRGHKKGDVRNFSISNHGNCMVQIKDVEDSGYDGYNVKEFNKHYVAIEMFKSVQIWEKII